MEDFRPWIGLHFAGVLLVLVCLFMVNGVLSAVVWPVLSALLGFLGPTVPAYLTLWGIPALIYLGIFHSLRQRIDCGESRGYRVATTFAPWGPVLYVMLSWDLFTGDAVPSDQLLADWAPVLVSLFGFVLWVGLLIGLHRMWTSGKSNL